MAWGGRGKTSSRATRTTACRSRVTGLKTFEFFSDLDRSQKIAPDQHKYKEKIKKTDERDTETPLSYQFQRLQEAVTMRWEPEDTVMIIMLAVAALLISLVVVFG